MEKNSYEKNNETRIRDMTLNICKILGRGTAGLKIGELQAIDDKIKTYTKRILWTIHELDISPEITQIGDITQED